MAMQKYLHCFSTREDLKDRYAEYIGKVKENKAKINTKTANVHDAMKVATACSIVPMFVEEVARDVVSKKIVEDATLGVEIDAIPILDTSGSMYSNRYLQAAIHQLPDCHSAAGISGSGPSWRPAATHRIWRCWSATGS